MAAPYCRTQLRLWWKNSTLWSCQAAKRRFTLSTAKQNKKKSSKQKEREIDNVLNLISAQKSPYPQNNSKGNLNLMKGRKSNSQLHANDYGVPVRDDPLMEVPSFKEILHDRHSEAKRSVVIRTQNPESTIQSLISFGGLKHAHFTSQDKSYILAEFANENHISKLRLSAGFFSETNQFPMHSRVLFDTSTRPHKKRIPLPQVDEANWQEKSSNIYPVMDTMVKELGNLCTRRSLDDNDLRSRFFVCLQIEELMQSFLPESHVIPYGSCLNGFGWWNSDLDMMLCFNNGIFTTEFNRTSESNNRASNFKILTEVFSSSRHLAQRTLAMVASLLELAPRMEKVFKILNARVPIIRFKNLAVNLNCDISVQQMDSIKMTELLYLYSVCDPRVKPLMSCIKQWAIYHSLTSSGEQQKPTTIGILHMLIFYLQTRSPAVVPTLREMQSLARTTEMFYIDNIVYGLPSNPSSLPRSQNMESIESLLHGFFTFYSEFDFKNKAISIIEGATYTKPADSTPVHIENPLCIGLNICRNVGSIQLSQFTDAMKEAALKLEQAVNQDGKSNVASILSDKSQKSRLSLLFSSSHIEDKSVSVEMSDLFAKDDLAAAVRDDTENDTVENGSVQTDESFDTEFKGSTLLFHSPGTSKVVQNINSDLGQQDDLKDSSSAKPCSDIHDYHVTDSQVCQETSHSAKANKTS